MRGEDSESLKDLSDWCRCLILKNFMKLPDLKNIVYCFNIILKETRF